MFVIEIKYFLNGKKINLKDCPTEIEVEEGNPKDVTPLQVARLILDHVDEEKKFELENLSTKEIFRITYEAKYYH